jgi:hypothetical protein
VTTEQISQSSEEDWIEPSTPEAFRVCDDNSANWVIRKILEERAYALRCEAWFEHEKRRAEKNEEFFWFRYGAQLRDYIARKIAEKGGKRKSLPLPAGTAGFRSEPDKIVVDDDDLLLSWAKAKQPGLIRVTERVSKTALNEHVKATGELPDRGVHVEPAREKFYVK